MEEEGCLTAVNPENDVPQLRWTFGWCPDVQIQTVFADAKVRVPHIDAEEILSVFIGQLHAGGFGLHGFQCFCPRLDGLRTTKSKLADRRLCEWNAVEDRQLAV